MPELYSTTNLIINNIPSAISDEQLNKLFSTFGSIKSCKIIRSNEKDSKAFGFCEYNDARSAKQALLQLDNYRLNDRILKVSYAKLFPKPKGKCIEVVNLPKTTQEEMVRKYFGQFGRIARLRLLFNNINGNQTKTAEIVYENKADADKAVIKNMVKWNYDNSKHVIVMVSLTSSEKSKSERELNDSKVVNNNLLYINSTKQLGDNHFYLQQSNLNNASHNEQNYNANAFDLSNLNNIVNCASFTPIFQNPFQFSNGFYSTQHFNNVAIQIPQYNSYEINDKTIQSFSAINNAFPIQYPFGYPNYNYVNTSNQLPLGIPLMYTPLPNTYPIKTAYEKSMNPIKPDYIYSNSSKSISRNSYVVYVYNIGNSTTKEQLKELFAPKFGKEIIKVDVPKDSQNGSNKNFGFVTFGNYQKAQLAIQEMNGKEFQGKPLQVSFKK